MQDAYICAYVRTPIGRYGGALSSIRADDLGAVPLRALMERVPTLDPAEIDEVIMGCANQAGEDNRNVARMSLLLAGLPESVPGVTVNRLCGSGMEAITTAARLIRSNEADVVVAGGVESMSRAPFVMPKATSSFARTNEVHDTTIGWRFVNQMMHARYGTDSMPETAENVATDYQISRADQDTFALLSQQKAAAAQASGRLANEITPVTIPRPRGDPIIVDTDEHPRADTTLDTLAKLKPIVRVDGLVTAGNASGVNDGAAALLIASETAIKAHGLIPLARFVGGATAGVPPRVMGIGPAPASQKLMDRLGMSQTDFDVIELNEAFASQALATLRMLDIDDADVRVNRNGGAIALGHPLGMSGARIVGSAATELHVTGGVRALATMCIGVGQGISMVIERC
ncbi:3-oxoadipyl-CoA thiolase [Roseobacter sp. YSTF-M11]|uniref:Beta-ketoadipyl-CoA thiolase n=1 Tax=Roseobacter insulae TaxID=2859783 RepID=A0A9X1FRA2_9RHOB|nr:3-oxoadipyl-CoA thiolase [Roseobacter insulae]MBW4706341.1 3-oxoadipyl-CoA thiolase [Roseobacter insulae]